MIYFLDFDGCLHRFFPLEGEDEASNALFAFVPQFEEAIRACKKECGKVEIVVSSSWRHKYSLEQMKQNFSSDIQEMMIGVTPKIGAGASSGARQDEVELWLRQQGRTGEPWIGVDDYPQLYKEGATVVACCDQFAERETQLLLEATKDPKAFAQKYPVPLPYNHSSAHHSNDEQAQEKKAGANPNTLR